MCECMLSFGSDIPFRLAVKEEYALMLVAEFLLILQEAVRSISRVVLVPIHLSWHELSFTQRKWVYIAQALCACVDF